MGTSVSTGTAEDLGAPAPRTGLNPPAQPAGHAAPPTRAPVPASGSAPARARGGGPPAAAAGGRHPAGRGVAAWLAANFRLHGEHDPAPRPARMVGLCAWAAALGLIGLPIAGRSSVAIMMGSAPGWFEPVVVAVGLAGIAMTSAAFAGIHRERVPWRLLTAATVTLVVNLALVLIAL